MKDPGQAESGQTKDSEKAVSGQMKDPGQADSGQADLKQTGQGQADC